MPSLSRPEAKPQNATPPVWLNAKRVASMLGVAKRNIYGLAVSGKLTAYRIGGCWRFEESDVVAYLEAARNGPARRPKKSGGAS